MLMGPASYQTLVGEYGWTPQQWRGCCQHAVSTMLFTGKSSRTASQDKRSS
jgi:hypothetical protein